MRSLCKVVRLAGTRARLLDRYRIPQFIALLRPVRLEHLARAFPHALALVVAVGVENIGWRATLRWLAAGILLLGLLVSRWVKARPDDHHQPIDGISTPPGQAEARATEWNVPYRDAIRSSAFRRIVGFNLAADFGRLAYLTHLVAFVERDLGASPVAAGAALTVSTLASFIGRLGAGVLADRLAVRRVSAATMAPFAAGAVVLALSTEPWHAYAAAVLGGIGFGASIPVRPAMYVEYFGLVAFGRVMGLGRLASTTGGFAGGALLGLIVDANDGSYAAGWWLVAAVVVCSTPLVLSAAPPRDLQRRYRTDGR